MILVILAFAFFTAPVEAQLAARPVAAPQTLLEQINALVRRQRVQYHAESGTISVDSYADSSQTSIESSFSAPVAKLDLSTLGVGITPVHTYQLTIFCAGNANCATSINNPPEGDGMSHPYSAIWFSATHEDGNKLLAALRAYFHVLVPAVVPLPKFASTFPPMPEGMDLSKYHLMHSASGDATPSSQGHATSTEEGAASESAAQWQQDHQAKIDELTQEIADHERQAEQDDADAEQADAQVQQDESANSTGPGAGWLALGHAVQGAMNAGLGEKMRRDAAQERQQAADERQQLAELGAEQPPVAQNNSESIALTRMQTQMIQSGNTIQGTADRRVQNIQAIQQAQNEERERSQEEREQQAQQSAVSGSSFSQPAQTTSASMPANASASPPQAVSQCEGFPAFITANETSTGASSITASIQFNVPAGFSISGQVGIYQGAQLQTALQEIQHGYQGHDWGVETGEGDTTYATAVSSSVAGLEVAQGGVLVGTFIILDNGSLQETYRGDAQGTVPSPLALTLMAAPSSCQRSIAGAGAGTVH